jgi:hypothetical protein
LGALARRQATDVGVIEQQAKRSNLSHVKPSADVSTLSLTYDVPLNEGREASSFSSAKATANGVSAVVLIASKNDVDS